MKTVRRNHCHDNAHKNESSNSNSNSNIDNEWTNFLMGGCNDDQESPTSTRHECDNGNRDHRNKLKLDHAYASKKKTMITTTNITADNCNQIQIHGNDDDDYKNDRDRDDRAKKTKKQTRSCRRHTTCNDDDNNDDNNECSSDENNDDNNEHSSDDNNHDNGGHGDDTVVKEAPVIQVPTCSPIYISTKTKITFLNSHIDIKKVFWDIPIMPYASQCSGIIKKQIKFSCTTKEELEEINAHTQKEIDKNDGFIETQIIEHIDNPDGRIKFKDHRKINIGLSKKDILNCRSKKKRAFFNCFVLIIRVEDENSPPHERIFKEMHIKVFNTGKLEIPGIQHDDSLQNVIDILLRTLKTIVGDHIDCKKNNCETVLINSNFNCGFYIDRDKLYNILKYEYRINSNYDSCSYPGIQCKFFYYVGRNHDAATAAAAAAADHHNHNHTKNQNGQKNKQRHIQNGQQPTTDLTDYIEISFMIFRTGSVLIVGKCEDYVLHDIYDFIKELFRVEFLNIYSHIIQPDDDNVKKHVPKLRTRTIINSY